MRSRSARFKLIPDLYEIGMNFKVLRHLIFELLHLKNLGVRTTHPLQLADYNKILDKVVQEKHSGCSGSPNQTSAILIGNEKTKRTTFSNDMIRNTNYHDP